METPQQFSARAWDLFCQARQVSRDISGDEIEMWRLMSQAKSQKMTWVEGLEFAIHQMSGTSGD